MLGNFYWYSFPEIYMFPRSKNSLFSYQANLRGNETGIIAFNNYLPSFADYENQTDQSENCIMQDYKDKTVMTKLKEIDYRLYMDLWSSFIPKKNNDETISYHTVTSKKITLCFLNKLSENKYCIYHKNKEALKPDAEDYFHLLKVKIKVDSKETNKHIEIEYRNKEGILQKTSTEWMEIPVSDFNEKYMLELSVKVYDSTLNVPSSDKCSFDIITKLARNTFSSNTEQKISLQLHRHNQNMNGPEDNLFEHYRKNKNGNDHDFFVLPRKNQTDDHSLIMKRLQHLNNQVIARHKKINDTDFSFLDEDGKYSEMQGNALRKSIEVFKETKSTDYEKITSICPCHFEKYGPAENLTWFLSQNYLLHEDEVKKIIVDRNFLFGDDDKNKIYGIESLYQNIVVPFNEAIIEEAEKYVNFNQPWLSRPKNNPNYQRGNYVVRAEDEIQIFAHETENVFIKTIAGLTEGTMLPAGSEISFHNGADVHDYEEGPYRYDISSVQISNMFSKSFARKTAYVSLTRKQKARCNDKIHPENHGNYMNFDGVSDPRDIEALKAYGESYGVPYYISELPSTGGKDTAAIFENRLINLPDNWYSYNDNPKSKPSAPTNPEGKDLPGIGLDCSGFIMNCLLDTKVNHQSFFQERDRKRANGERARDMGRERSRKIDITKRSDTAHCLIQAGDLIYSTGHISFCAIEKNKNLVIEEIKSRYFTIIHNYGESNIFITKNIPNVKEGHFCRTLKGPFRHWGINLSNNQILDEPKGNQDANAGRIFLWY
jgi:hypothetical protein